MVALIKENQDWNRLVYEYISDTYNELPLVSTMGSTAYVIEDGASYIYNGDGEWVECINEESGGGSQSFEWAELDAFFSSPSGSSSAHVYGYVENAETGMYEFGIHNVLMSDTVGRKTFFMPMIDGVASWIYSTSPASGKSVAVDNSQSQGITIQGNYIVQAEASSGNRLVFKVIDSQPSI